MGVSSGLAWPGLVSSGSGGCQNITHGKHKNKMWHSSWGIIVIATALIEAIGLTDTRDRPTMCRRSSTHKTSLEPCTHLCKHSLLISPAAYATWPNPDLALA